MVFDVCYAEKEFTDGNMTTNFVDCITILSLFNI